jgi:hypothetical protein
MLGERLIGRRASFLHPVLVIGLSKFSDPSIGRRLADLENKLAEEEEKKGGK